MARRPIGFDELVRLLMTTLERDGATVRLDREPRRRPASIRVVSADRSVECLLFLWNVTGGGGGPGVRPPNERRIQITGADEGFPLLPGVRTVVGGLSVDDGVWVFWDPRRHSRFSRRSPSLQTTLPLLQKALESGIATQRRETEGGTEVVVAVAPASLLWYLLDGQGLHDAGEDADEVADLVDAGVEGERQFIDSAESESATARRYQIVECVRAFRDSRFRPQVVRAYACRCAISGIALRLVDAAHIVPVSHPRGTDDVQNGVALSRLHHAAYDMGLIGITEDYEVVLNPHVCAHLRNVGLADGLERFAAALPAQIELPAMRDHWPDRKNLRLGMEIRGF